MTPERLAEIEARTEAATSGPWHRVGPPWNDDTAYVIAGDEDPHAGAFVCDLAALADEGNANDVADAEFIAHARTDVPDLIAEVRRLRAAVDAALALHGPEKRYHDGSAEWSTDDPAEIAEEHNYPLDEVPFFEVCAACGEIEMSQSDHASYLESMWPCATARALAPAADHPTDIKETT